MIPAIHYFVLYYDLTVSMLIWSFSAMGNGHCVADLEALISGSHSVHCSPSNHLQVSILTDRHKLQRKQGAFKCY